MEDKSAESSEGEGRIAKLIKEAHAVVDSGLCYASPTYNVGALNDEDDDITFLELQRAQKEQMIAEGKVGCF